VQYERKARAAGNAQQQTTILTPKKRDIKLNLIDQPIPVLIKSHIQIPKSKIKTLHLHMPYKEREISKMYYTMGEVSAMFGVNQSLIRFYEKEFDVLQPKKNKKGNRYFTPEDLENFKIIFHLINDKGYTLQGAKDHLKHNMGDTRDHQRVIDSLEDMKKFLLEVRDQL
jgi:DNA-binding transcriptional MerR regulator